MDHSAQCRLRNTHRVGLYYYDNDLEESTHPVDYQSYEHDIGTYILRMFDSIKMHYTESINQLLAIERMLKKVEVDSEHMDDILLHRILFFCSKSSANSATSLLSKQRLRGLRERLQSREDIILECVQVSTNRNPRNNTDLKGLCDINGRYWKLSIAISNLHRL